MNRTKNIVLLLISFHMVTSFSIRDKFLYCKISSKKIDPVLGCLDEMLYELNCRELKEVLHNFSLNQNEFNLLKRNNQNGSEDINVFYSSNKDLFFCDCIEINEIEVPDEIDSNNNYCIADMFVHFNGLNGFLTKNGIIKEKTSSIVCDNNPRYFYSLTNSTEFIQLNKKILFKQFIYPKHAKLIKQKTDYLPKQDLDLQFKELKVLELLLMKLVNSSNDGLISNTNEDLIIVVSFGLIFLGIMILLFKCFGLNNFVSLHQSETKDIEIEDDQQIINFEKLKEDFKENFKESLNTAFESLFLKIQKRDNESTRDLNEVQTDIKTKIDNDYKNIIEIFNKNEDQLKTNYSNIEDKIISLHNKISEFVIEMSDSKSFTSMIKTDIEAIHLRIGELKNNQDVLCELNELIKAQTETVESEAKRKPRTRSK